MTEERRRVQHPGGGESRVKQADRGQTDINEIMRRFAANGVPPPINGKTPVYGDFSNSGDFHTQLNRVIEAQDEFDLLPAEVRKYCKNDVGVFFDKVADDDEVAKLLELGMPSERLPQKENEENAQGNGSGSADAAGEASEGAVEVEGGA